MEKTLVIGAGPSGLASAKRLSEKSHDVTVIDKRGYTGGLCSSFNIDGYIFDRFVHFSFTQNKDVISLFNKSCNDEVREFKPSVYNLYHGKFIMHPVQNNLSSLGTVKGLSYLLSYLQRDKENIFNYYDWLCASYGKKFADDFPLLYTLKYWCTDPKNMETKWIGPRMSDISFKDFIVSIFSKKEHLNYYHKSQRYPEYGGYNSFLNALTGNYKVQLNTELLSLDLANKKATTSNGEYQYDNIVYTAPLKELYKYVCSDASLESNCAKLHHTGGYMVSIALDKKPNNKGVFFYIYDKDILFPRAYYPYLKSMNNVPEGKYSIQLEFYTLDGKELDDPNKGLDDSVSKVLSSIGLSYDNVIFKDIKFEKYANILFDHNIYEARNSLYNFCENNNLYLAGRFGKWDYLWSDQSVVSGFLAADKILKKSCERKNA